MRGKVVCVDGLQEKQKPNVFMQTSTRVIYRELQDSRKGRYMKAVRLIAILLPGGGRACRDCAQYPVSAVVPGKRCPHRSADIVFRHCFQT
jgi:hypothetical protein